MPRLSCVAIRTALIHLLIGGTLGSVLLANKALAFWPWIWSWRTPHIHLLLVGWSLQLAFGVAFWIMPRISASGARGSTWLGWVAYLALNFGICIVLFERVIVASSPLRVASWLCYLVAALAMTLHSWPRLKALAAPDQIEPR